MNHICFAILLVLLAQPRQLTQTPNSAAQADQPSKIPEGEAHFTADQLNKYYLVYDNPDVRYLRAAFDAYLQGKAKSTEETKWLDKWSKDYYRSKFIVLSRQISTFGGTLITMMFQDRPDKVFVAWIYGEGTERALTLRRFDQSPGFTDGDVKRIRIRYRAMLEDKSHAM
ncbi:MAG TPA: hypothetical protein VEI54_03460 [Candidatus Limnocylindrales bacterium]|nr:hypothetical protein [Candidatus Limnocylindrales bacterium]